MDIVMNKWDQIRKDILAKTPHIKTLPLMKRIGVWFKQERSEAVVTVMFPDTGDAEFIQYYITEQVDGKEYVRRWGRLRRSESFTEMGLGKSGRGVR